ncbi:MULTISPECIES: hypothetical protein [unclassified Nocardia]|uniref:hypothetical protein n=1 Tax=unclassified Nocardia TaxID=2637762 RepID=UPI001CE46AC9|nr:MULTISPECIES: hypothetical protein [unclassified Nocardia]
MAATPETKRLPVRASIKGKSAAVKAKKAKVKMPKVRHFKTGDRVRFTYGKREVEGTVTSIFGDRVHVDMHFTSESTPGLFRENELRRI